MADKSHHPATLAAHAAGAVGAGGAIVPGIETSTTYRRGPDYALEAPRNIYSRDNNDTTRQAEAVICALENGEEALLFASGMAAASAVFRAVPSGGRIIVQSGIYYGIIAFLTAFCARRGITLDAVDTSDLKALEDACSQPANLVWVEVPSNPWMRITDLRQAAELSHNAKAILAVDSTASTPILTRPLDLGADIVMHSATKAMNGHSDVLAGVLVCRDKEHPFWHQIATDRHDSGAVLGPFEAWLLLRGLRTLPLRMGQMCQNAQTLAETLTKHPQVSAVWYPGLSTHPQHDLAKAQMSGGFGYLMSVLVKGGEAKALEVAGRLQLIHRATSLGGVESLIEHRHSIEPQSGLPPELLRLSVGIEDVGDLLDDLMQALG